MNTAILKNIKTTDFKGWIKPIFWIFVLFLVAKFMLGITGIFTKIGNTLINPFGSSEAELNEQKENASTVVTLVENIPGNGTLSNNGNWYPIAASQLFTAMDGAGTDKSVIASVLSKIKNDSDAKELILAFGVKKHTTLWVQTNGHLIDWFGWELSDMPPPIGDMELTVVIKERFKNCGIPLPW